MFTVMSGMQFAVIQINTLIQPGEVMLKEIITRKIVECQNSIIKHDRTDNSIGDFKIMLELRLQLPIVPFLNFHLTQ